MRKLLVFLTLIIIYSCNEDKKNQSKNEDKIEKNASNFYTIIKRTDHSQLDLERNQLYIDTSDLSISNKDLANWKPTSKKEIESNIENYQLKILDSEIPKKWITIRKYNDEFFNYDRCDGKDPRIEIIGNAMIFDGIQEKNIFHLDEIRKVKSGWILKPSSNSILEFSFEKTDKKDIFIYKFKRLNETYKSYVTPFENLNNFNYLVNHCPNEKVDEFSEFQNPE